MLTLTPRSGARYRWGQFSVLETDLICMADLWRFKTWKYFINLTGQEFPLRTNYELVRILKVFNGSNSLEGTRKRSGLGCEPLICVFGLNCVRCFPAQCLEECWHDNDV